MSQSDQPSAARTRPSWTLPGRHAAFAALGLLSIAVYVPAFSAVFLWDDTIIVNLPEQVRGFADIWLNPGLIESEGHYWPVVYSTFWVEHMLWGQDPVGYHVNNVVLHAANAMLVYALLRRLSVPGAWVAAAIFAVHPTHVDSVAWAIERKDVLSAFFYLLSVLAYVHWDEHHSTVRPAGGRAGKNRSGSGRRSRSGRGEAVYAASLVAFTLGLLSKSIVVTLPVMLLVYHWWRHGRVSGRELIRTVPFFVVAVGVTLGDLVYYASREGVSLDISLAERVQIAARSFWHYAQKLMWPSDLVSIYPKWEIDGSDLLGWGLLLAGVAVVGVLWGFRNRIGRGPFAGMAFFGGTLAPVLGFVDFGYMDTTYVADRFQYLAGIGLIALVVATVAFTVAELELQRGPSPTSTMVILCIPVLVILGTITWNKALDYGDKERFFTKIIAGNPSARGGTFVNLGNAYREQGRMEDAIAAYTQSLENDKPNVQLALNNLGSAHELLGETEEAESHYRQALEVQPSLVVALDNLATLLADRGEFTEADELLNKALKLNPNRPSTMNHVAVLHKKMGDFDQAENSFTAGIDRHPEHGELLANYGRFLHELNRLTEAEAMLRRAYEADIKPQDTAQSLATVLVQLGREDEAAELVGRGAIESLAPSIADAEFRRGNQLLKAGQLTKAVEAYRAAIAADADDVRPLVQLGVTYESLDRRDDALAIYRQAYDVDSEHISVVFYYGLLSARLEHHEEALVLFDEAESLFKAGLTPVGETEAELPELADVYANRSFVLVHLGRLEDALADTEQALELNPDLELASFNQQQILEALARRDGQDE